MAESTIDLATFKALQEAAGAEFVVKLVDTFLEEAPVMLGELRGALAKRDAEKFRRTAHSLKSNGLTFGALGLGAMARELELGGLEHALEAGPEPLAALEAEYARVAVALAELRHA
ncbi:MAG TPA: Hpt domain-containing protein [Usitatibacter sp.]|nr:Hpt domain-containing protein [Usitatibacter sp.]